MSGAPTLTDADALRGAQPPEPKAAAAAERLRCREVAAGDLPAVADLLARGFPGRSRAYWAAGLRRQAERDLPPGYPRFGYMIERAGAPVGVLLLIYAARERDGTVEIRCNVSSWYVEPEFRGHAAMLSRIAQRHRHVVYVNISPARWTWPTIETQGFRVYCRGTLFSLPALSRSSRGMRIEPFFAGQPPAAGLGAAEQALLARHAAYGCCVLVCRDDAGRRAVPFVLRPMHVGRLRLPAMQLIHCPGIDEFVACAGALGRFLLRRGWISVAVDADGPLKGLIGIYREPIGRKYFKGPRPPAHADLADTELAIYGP